MRFWKKTDSQKILLFVTTGVFISLAVSIFISYQLSTSVSKQIEERETQLILSAIESGPLNFARLHSSAIAQQEIDRLMSHPHLKDRGLVKIEIRSGENASFTYAKWKSPYEVDPSCALESSRNYNFVDAIHPFQISVTRDRCLILSERRAILANSSASSLFIALISILLLIIGAWPAVRSVRSAEKHLTGESASPVQEISFQPIRLMVEKALQSKEFEKRAAVADLASQVAHDIRSPLSALNLAVASTQLPENHQLVIKEALRRINNIANGLLDRGRSNTSEVKSINEILHSLVTEKKMEHGEEIQFHLRTPQEALETPIDSSTLERCLSNLINNAVEAIDSKGQVTVSLKKAENSAVIEISDSGRGIPETILGKIGKRGFSYRKDGRGNGLGVSFAKETIEKYAGQFKIISKVGSGTTVLMSLPQFVNPQS